MVKLDFTQILKDWEPILRQPVLETEYMERLIHTLNEQYKGYTVRPEKKDIFRAFKVTPFKDVRVVILGQDPYPNANATGVAFGNDPESTRLSPSLEKMQECIEDTIYNGFKLDFDPSLVSWAQQGVLLLNSALTVRNAQIGSHSIYWTRFTRSVIKAISDNKPGTIFLFLGSEAKKFSQFVNKDTCHLFTYYHPSFACRERSKWNCPYFKEINNIIEKQNGAEYCIKW